MKVLDFIKKNRVVVLLVSALLICVIAGIIISYAAFTGNSKAKRVISTGSVSNILFSSNVLKAPQIDKPLYGEAGNGNFTYTITVCNFDQMSPANFAKNDKIKYTLTAQLLKYDSTSAGYVPVSEIQYRNVENPGETRIKKVFTIQKVADDNETVSGTVYDLNGGANDTTFQATFGTASNPEELGAGRANTDSYLLTIDESELSGETPNYYIRVTATPVDSESINGTIPEMAAVLSLSRGSTHQAGWSGMLAEADNADYDAYNMIISGTGEGTVEVKWNNTLFDISDFFINDSSVQFVDASGNELTATTAVQPGEETVWSRVFISVDSDGADGEGGINRYEIQFFKKVSGTYTASTITNYIQFVGYTPSNAE